MKTKFGFIFLGVFFFTFFIGKGWAVDPRPDLCNNYDAYYSTRQVADSKKIGTGGEGTLSAGVRGSAWKDGTEFKWHAVAIAENESSSIKGRYTIGVEPPHDAVIVEFPGLDNVTGEHDQDPIYEGEIGVAIAAQSALAFNNQNAIIEVENITARSHITGYPLSADRYSLPLVLPHVGCAHLCFSDDGDGDNGANNNRISPTNPNQTPSPGNAYGLKVDTGEPFYYVSLYALAPWQTSGRGDYIGGESGDGTKTEAEFNYTFPSGSMHTGDFTITAVVSRWSDMSEYEGTYTVTVKNLGIFPTDPGPLGASPGSSYELGVVTDEDFYTITWFVKREGETGRGTQVDYDYGGTVVGNEATMSYTYNVIPFLNNNFSLTKTRLSSRNSLRLGHST